MTDANQNRIAAQIFKAEMIGDQVKVDRLKQELETIKKASHSGQISPGENSRHQANTSTRRDWRKQTNESRNSVEAGGSHQSNKVQMFLKNTKSLGQMFDQEKGVSAADEARMYLKTSAKFARDDMETKYFSTEIDDSQAILNKSKRHKSSQLSVSRIFERDRTDETCSRCKAAMPRHQIIHWMQNVCLALPAAKPFLSGMSNVYITNNDHRNGCSFVTSDTATQIECEEYIRVLESMWREKGCKLIIMETYHRDQRSNKCDFSSSGNHFRIQCIPIKEKHFEQARMSFKQALQECEQDWSMNKKLIVTQGRRIQRYLPQGLSYFWVCFGDLTNGFGHVIENERAFSRYFGLEVLSSLLDKDFNPMRLETRESYQETFDRRRDFKLMFVEHYDALKKSETKRGLKITES